MMLAAVERKVYGLITPVNLHDHAHWQARASASGTVAALSATDLEFDRQGLFDFLVYCSVSGSRGLGEEDSAEDLIASVAEEATADPLTEGERYILHLLRRSLTTGPLLGAKDENVERLTALVGDDALFFLVPGEVWTDALNRDMATLAVEKRTAWIRLLRHLLTVTATRPSAKWLKTATTLVQSIGLSEVAAAVTRWFPLVNRGRTAVDRIPAFYSDRSAGDLMHDENATALRGLCPSGNAVRFSSR